MNLKLKSVVYEILEKDELARTSDLYLIQQVLINMLDCNQGTAMGKVLQGMKVKGISFEAITRHRRKFIERYPQYKVEKARKNEEINYFMEFSKV